MLLRTRCRVYRSFAEHCSIHKKPTSEVLFKKYCDSPKPVSSKLLPSPKLPPQRTKLSPLLPFQEACNHVRHSSGSVTRKSKMGSTLERLVAGTQDPDNIAIKVCLLHRKGAEEQKEPSPLSPITGESTASSLGLLRGDASAERSPFPSLFCPCGRQCKETGSDGTPSPCEVCKVTEAPVSYSGYMYEPNRERGVWNRYWYRLLGDHLYRNQI
ncbi:MAG: hypothetical protein P4M11_12115 [Candidatus Pacebacteria bacterium]|nr:hypothetical protein [Candidatus Paceibacterota bacterium]